MNIIQCILGSYGKFHIISVLYYTIKLESEYNQIPAIVNDIEVSLAKRKISI